MKTVFIAHRISGNVKANLESIYAWIRWAVMSRKVLPFAPYVYLLEVFDEDREEERNIGLDICIHTIQYADELWICGPRPEDDSAVWKEVEEAKSQGIPVVDYTDLSIHRSFKDSLPMLCSTEDFRQRSIKSPYEPRKLPNANPS